MNKHLQSLKEIAKLDRQIDDLEPKIVEIRKVLDSKILQRNKTTKNIEILQEIIDNKGLEVGECERSIAENSTRLEEIAKKMSEITTDKQLRALSVEEDIAKENLSVANEQIRKLQAEQTTKKEEIATLQSQIDTLSAEIKEIEVDVEAQVAVVKKEQQSIFDERQKIVAKSDTKTIAFYEKIRRWARNTSVVPVFKQACGGCFVRINDKTYAEVLNEGDITICPHCGRILYPSNKQTYKECAI